MRWGGFHQQCRSGKIGEDLQYNHIPIYKRKRVVLEVNIVNESMQIEQLTDNSLRGPQKPYGKECFIKLQWIECHTMTLVDAIMDNWTVLNIIRREHSTSTHLVSNSNHKWGKNEGWDWNIHILIRIFDGRRWSHRLLIAILTTHRNFDLTLSLKGT